VPRCVRAHVRGRLRRASKPRQATNSLTSARTTPYRSFHPPGTSEANSFKDPTRLQGAEVIDDFDVDYAAEKVKPFEVGLARPSSLRVESRY
jgi:hypothetical protein